MNGCASAARLAFAGLLALLATGALAAGDADATWTRARAGVPAGVAGRFALLGDVDEPALADALRGDGPGRRVPAVVIVHGCAGISGEEETLLYLLTLNGYAVFMPDSFARPGREAQCDVATATAVVDPKIYRQREAEIVLARARIADLAWVDQRQVFLLGISEGGAAAAVHTGTGFAGVVIISWHCGGGSVNSGLRVPATVPVLALLMRDDPWYQPFQGRHCGEFFDGRAGSRSLRLPGEGHAVLSGADVITGERVKRELLRFFRRVRAPVAAAGGSL